MENIGTRSCCLIVVCLFVFLPQAFAQTQGHSVDQLSHGLQSLVDSSERLATVNDTLTAQNRALQKKLDVLRQKSGDLAASNVRLNDELVLYRNKTGEKAGSLELNQKRAEEFKERLSGMNHEIEMKKIDLSQHQKQQEYVLKLLNIVNGGGTVEQNIESISKTQNHLARQLQESDRRIGDLESQWKELSFWYGDSSQTLPQLAATRDQLKDKLAVLNASGVSENWSAYQKKIWELEKETKELDKSHSIYQRTLEVIENNYVGKNSTVQLRSDEKKLQQTLNRLKKDNKFLQKQGADLRMDMINLDKKRSILETEVIKNK